MVAQQDGYFLANASAGPGDYRGPSAQIKQVAHF
jgi:hypothetical protein